jgi:cell division protein FtsB
MGKLLHFRRKKGEPWLRGAASDARPDTFFPSDARPAEEPAPGKAPDPDRERRRRLYRSTIALFLGTIFIAGSAAALIGNHGYLGLRRSRQELALLRAKVDKKYAEVTELRKEVERLKSDPRAVERIAREHLGFTKPGEVTFLLPLESDRASGDRLSFPPPALRSTQKGPVVTPRD